MALDLTLRWHIVLLDLEPVVGHEQGARRPAVVVSYEPFHRAGLMTVCPITAARAEERYPTEVALPRGESGLSRDGVVLVSQVRTISTGRLVPGQSSSYVLRSLLRRAKVRRALAVHFGLDIPADEDTSTS